MKLCGAALLFQLVNQLGITVAVRDDLLPVNEGFCEKTDTGVKCVSEENMRLSRLTPGEVGETTPVTLDDDTVLQMKTISTKPLILEIPNFLTDKECANFIMVAKKEGLEKSSTERTSMGSFQLMDTNQDMVLNIKEVQITIENGFDIYMEKEDVLEMYKNLKLDTNGDTDISREEIQQIKPVQLREYLLKFLYANPVKHSRYSKQAWPYLDNAPDDQFTAVQNRVSKVLRLPLDLIRLSDFQVVNYDVSGHYNAHHDSSVIDRGVPCCDRGRVKNCRICRYMTMLFYLNDVEGGGETAFPVANNDTFDVSVIHHDRISHLYKKCQEANLRVNAEKGKAVIWYNHLVDEETGWMGQLDNYTLHGGCPVTKGEKWIANFWVKTSEDKSQDLKKMSNLYK